MRIAKQNNSRNLFPPNPMRIDYKVFSLHNFFFDYEVFSLNYFDMFYSDQLINCVKVTGTFRSLVSDQH